MNDNRPRPTPPHRRRWRAAAALALSLVLAGPLACQTATATAPGSRRVVEPTPCTSAQRQASLTAERSRVLAAIGNLTTISSWPQLIELAGTGWAGLVHGFMSQRGLGLTITRTDSPLSATNILIPVPGTPAILPTDMPDVVWYAPDPKATGVEDPHNPAFPYHLVGWSYGDAYRFEQHPADKGPACLTRADWLVHERGIHDAATLGFVPEPPVEEFKGQNPGNTPVSPWELFAHPGVVHNRVWMVNLWLGPGGELTPNFDDPYESIKGVDPQFGSWYFRPPPAP